MKDRFCPYHQGFVLDEGFKFIPHPATGTSRGMCPSCQAKRKRPHHELVALAAREKAERDAYRAMRNIKVKGIENE